MRLRRQRKGGQYTKMRTLRFLTCFARYEQMYNVKKSDRML